MLVEAAILLTAVPAGYFIARLARDELVAGSFWFRVIIVVGAVVGLWFFLTGHRYITWSAGYVLIIAVISLVKSYDKKWTKIR